MRGQGCTFFGSSSREMEMKWMQPALVPVGHRPKGHLVAAQEKPGAGDHVYHCASPAPEQHGQALPGDGLVVAATIIT